MKFDNKGIVMMFTGYTDVYNTYRVLDSESEQVIIACDIVPLQHKSLNEIDKGNKNNVSRTVSVSTESKEENTNKEEDPFESILETSHGESSISSMDQGLQELNKKIEELDDSFDSQQESKAEESMDLEEQLKTALDQRGSSPSSSGHRRTSSISSIIAIIPFKIYIQMKKS